MTSTISDERLSVALLTGFLGSGKTTFLNLLLKRPSMTKTAVLVNEFGNIGIDNLLVEAIDGNTLLMESGCVCCTIRDALAGSINDLLERRARRGVPPFERIVVETTGLAKPGPIIQTLASDPTVFGRIRLDGVITMIDAVSGMTTLTLYGEALAQAAVADTLVLSKTDLADDESVNAITRRLRAINPTALQVRAQDESISPSSLLHATLYDPDTKTVELSRWMRRDAIADELRANRPGHAHDDGIDTFCLVIEDPAEWEDIAAWLDVLAMRFGHRLLRVKGILNVEQTNKPVVIHGVQGFYHPPGELSAWPSGEERRSRIVFITDKLDRADILEPLKERQALRVSFAT